MAEFERSLIKERTRAGLDAAKAQGRTGGRPSVVNEDVLTVVRARKAKGESVSAIAKALGVSRATLYRHLGDDSRRRHLMSLPGAGSKQLACGP
ncbi:helix-turn-helix domain-containing protein [Streptomyces althioticus]